jgi:hypothetical protein
MKYWLAVLERAVKTFAQTTLALWGADVGLNAIELNWKNTLGTAALAAGLSVLTSLASTGFGSSGPSVGPETLT